MQEKMKLFLLNNKLRKIRNNVLSLKNSIDSLNELLEDSFIIDDKIIAEDEIMKQKNLIGNLLKEM